MSPRPDSVPTSNYFHNAQPLAPDGYETRDANVYVLTIFENAVARMPSWKIQTTFMMANGDAISKANLMMKEYKFENQDFIPRSASA
jgi:hypothetical protein